MLTLPLQPTEKHWLSNISEVCGAILPTGGKTRSVPAHRGDDEVVVERVSFCNSPDWTVHPVFCGRSRVELSERGRGANILL